MSYLSIKHDIKMRFDWGWPLILAAITMALFWYLPKMPSILGEAGFLKGVRDLIALLAAFFVAALAAVATFARDSLDKNMEGTTPTLDGHDLTRRQFVTYLFGYLAMLSFLLFFVIVCAQIIAPSLRDLLSPLSVWWVKAISGAIFAFWFWNLMVTTMLGVYFLVERVHIKDED